MSRTLRAIAATLALSVGVAAAPARADAGTDFSWQIGLADASAAGLMTTGFVRDGDLRLIIPGGVLALAGGPVIHALHDDGDPGRSIQLRVTMPLLGIAALQLLKWLTVWATGGEARLSAQGFAIGAAIGWVGASLIDITATHRDAEADAAARTVFGLSGAF